MLIIRMQVGKESSKVVGTELDAIQLSIFSHRFMSTAEQMGRCDDYCGIVASLHNAYIDSVITECFSELPYQLTLK